MTRVVRVQAGVPAAAHPSTGKLDEGAPQQPPWRRRAWARSAEEESVLGAQGTLAIFLCLYSRIKIREQIE